MSTTTLWKPNTIGFLKSYQVKVFPCSYRGNYLENDKQYFFDPESSANTESTIVNLYSKLSKNKESYLINIGASDSGKSLNEHDYVNLSFILGGYYFELKDVLKTDLQNKYLVINLKENQVISTERDGTRITHCLASLNEDTDTTLDIPNNGNYYFVGLGLVSSATSYSYSLQPLLYENSTYKENWSEYSILNSLDTDKGINSVRSAKSSNNAYGKYSTALGENNNISTTGEYSVAIGKSNRVTKTNSLTIGNNNTVNNNNAHLLGHHLTSDTNNQTIIGKYNTVDSSKPKSFVIGNGTNDSHRSNILEIDTAGNIKSTGTNLKLNESEIKYESSTVKINKPIQTQGSVEIANDGSLEVSGNKIRFKKSEGYFDSIVYDDTNTTLNTNVKIAEGGNLEVEGDTVIKGTLEIEADGSILKDTEVDALTVKELLTANQGISITGSTTLNGTLTVNGKTVLNNELEVASGKLTKLGGNVSITDKLEVGTSKTTLKQDSEILGTLTVGTEANNKKTTLNGELEVLAKTTLSSLETSGNIEIGGTITSQGNATLNGNLVVADTKETTLGGKVTIKGNSEIHGNSELKGTLTIGTEENKKKTTLNGELEVLDKTTLSNDTKIQNGGTLELVDRIDDPTIPNVTRTGNEIKFKSSERVQSGDLPAIAESNASLKYDSVKFNMTSDLHLVNNGTYKNLTAGQIDLSNSSINKTISLGTNGICTSDGIINDLKINSTTHIINWSDSSYIQLASNLSKLYLNGSESGGRFVLYANNDNYLAGTTNSLTWKNNEITTENKFEETTLYRYLCTLFSKNEDGVITEELHFEIITTDSDLFITNDGAVQAISWDNAGNMLYKRNIYNLHKYLNEIDATHPDRGLPVTGYFRDSDDFDMRVSYSIYFSEGRIKVGTFDPEDDNNHSDSFKIYKNFGWVSGEQTEYGPKSGAYYESTESGKRNRLFFKKTELYKFKHHK